MPLIARPVPQNISALNPNGFLFSIQKYPELTYFIQEAPLPGLSLGIAMHATSVHDIKTPGDTMEFDDIQLSFIVDENLDNYKSIYDWITGLGFPTGNKQFRDFVNSDRNNQGYPASTAQKTVSDCSLTILNSDNIAMSRFDFVDAFPTSLSGLTFQSTNNDLQYIVATVTLAYSYYTIVNVELPGTRNAIFLGLEGNEMSVEAGDITAQADNVHVPLRGSFIKVRAGDLGCIATTPHSAYSTDVTIDIQGIEASGVV